MFILQLTDVGLMNLNRLKQLELVYIDISKHKEVFVNLMKSNVNLWLNDMTTEWNIDYIDGRDIDDNEENNDAGDESFRYAISYQSMKKSLSIYSLSRKLGLTKISSAFHNLNCPDFSTS